MPIPIPFINNDRQPWELAGPPAAVQQQSPTSASYPAMTMKPARTENNALQRSRRSSIDKALSAETDDTSRTMPAKYMQSARPLPAMTDFDSGFGFTTRAVEAPSIMMPAATGTGSATGPPAIYSDTKMDSTKMRGDELPVMPAWIIGLLAGLLSFGLIVAVALYLANFPPEWAWLRSIQAPSRQRTSKGYTKLSEKDEDESHEPRGCKTPNLHSPEPTTGLGISYASSSTAKGGGGLAARRRKNLSVDTSATYGGLHIAMPGSAYYDEVNAKRREQQVRQQQQQRRRRRSSYDEEKLLHREPPPLSPARFAWEALTAPIPGIATFSAIFGGGSGGGGGRKSSGDGGLRYYEREPELKSGTYTPGSALATDTEAFGTPAEASVPESRGANVFHRIGESVEHAAAKLGKVLSDVVDGNAEEGLFLPVRDSERERGYEPVLRVVA
ncbi:hypothetical protein B0A55_07850 [Friedmanniomyces simplex]|uniref:Uncharacterized protein n=1 Tax=Friedmanniomyces simplex TaxID=329884 RepID=A0A4V5NF51_9PEZI|nr:hypothetical protein B0A55_07850 [Friedmanniomyces simplex]